jgi:hypothetical protein
LYIQARLRLALRGQGGAALDAEKTVQTATADALRAGNACERFWAVLQRTDLPEAAYSASCARIAP